jgi:hypothetical protein
MTRDGASEVGTERLPALPRRWAALDAACSQCSMREPRALTRAMLKRPGAFGRKILAPVTTPRGHVEIGLHIIPRLQAWSGYCGSALESATKETFHADRRIGPEVLALAARHRRRWRAGCPDSWGLGCLPDIRRDQMNGWDAVIALDQLLSFYKKLTGDPTPEEIVAACTRCKTPHDPLGLVYGPTPRRFRLGNGVTRRARWNTGRGSN